MLKKDIINLIFKNLVFSTIMLLFYKPLKILIINWVILESYNHIYLTAFFNFMGILISKFLVWFMYFLNKYFFCPPLLMDVWPLLEEKKNLVISDDYNRYIFIYNFLFFFIFVMVNLLIYYYDLFFKDRTFQIMLTIFIISLFFS